MSANIKEAQLLGEWVRSRDGGAGQIVLLPPDLAPPSRGRQAIRFEPGGGAKAMSPGPDDRTAAAPGGWRLEGDLLTIDAPGWSGTYKVESTAKDRIVLTRT